MLSFFCLLGCGEKQDNTSQQDKSNTTTQSKEKAESKSSKKESKKTTTAKAPDTFRVLFSTTQGDFVIEVTRSWSPNGADRLYELVSQDFFTDIAFFRAIEGFMIQLGINGDPNIAS